MGTIFKSEALPFVKADFLSMGQEKFWEQGNGGELSIPFGEM